MARHRLAALILIGAASLTACKKDRPTEITPGPPASLTASATSVSAQAAQPVATALTITVRDANGTGVPDETVTFVVEGGGTLASSTAVSGPNGVVTVPAWTFGKSAVPQTLRATLGTVPAAVINGTVLTSYDIVVRQYGPTTMTASQLALFTNAAARIRGIVTGNLPAVQMIPEAGDCFGNTLNEVVDDVVIFASIQPRDGAGGVLAAAGPCFIRTTSHLTVVGVMEFDSEDIPFLEADGTLQEVITHEMLHVLGIGSLWDDGQPDFEGDVPLNSLLQDPGTSNPRYTGAQARAACQAIGGSIACASSVPVENTGGVGTQDAHWRETTFETEMLTGFAEFAPGMPLSRITIGGLADLGYTVNNAAFDQYTVFLNAFRVGTSAPKRTNWEGRGPSVVKKVDAQGNVTGMRVIQ